MLLRHWATINILYEMFILAQTLKYNLVSTVTQYDYTGSMSFIYCTYFYVYLVHIIQGEYFHQIQFCGIFGRIQFIERNF